MKHARMAAEATIPDVLDRKQRNNYKIIITNSIKFHCSMFYSVL